ncbi:hypothetical protein D9613_008964 [Agrocybe pediades]|uniref:Extracellular serine-rich protein n=1 Tax=Agrocybe pediades TaxID=84607 RepID=A0A8H4R2V8_9AGAR|nr:hypothetical protein D9613_008964 [Agrocybe pediades]
MLFAAATLAFVSAAAAQTVQVVTVGGTSATPGFIFTPSTITAANGTVVSFQFTGIPGNHSVTQSSFTDPCNPIQGGFDSGNIFINTTQATTPTFNLTITNDSKPIWFFCKQLKPMPHCGQGMVGSINAPATGNTFDKFQASAKVVGTATVGQGEGGLVGVGASASASVSSQAAITIFTGAPVASNSAAAGGNATGSGSGSSTATAPGGNGTGTGGASHTPGAATDVAVSTFTVFISAVLGAFFL